MHTMHESTLNTLDMCCQTMTGGPAALTTGKHPLTTLPHNRKTPPPAPHNWTLENTPLQPSHHRKTPLQPFTTGEHPLQPSHN